MGEERDMYPVVSTKTKDTREKEINRDNDDAIIGILTSVLNNGTGHVETFNENVLVKLMQMRGTPITNFKFIQEQVDACYDNWYEHKQRGNRNETD